MITLLFCVSGVKSRQTTWLICRLSRLDPEGRQYIWQHIVEIFFLDFFIKAEAFHETPLMPR